MHRYLPGARLSTLLGNAVKLAYLFNVFLFLGYEFFDYLFTGAVNCIQKFLKNDYGVFFKTEGNGQGLSEGFDIPDQLVNIILIEYVGINNGF